MNTSSILKTALVLIIMIMVTAMFFAAVVQAASANIKGYRMHCGAAARIIDDPYLPNLGEAVLNRRYMILNKRLLSRYPSAVARLVFLHECGHLQGIISEIRADCWAVRIAKRQGWLRAKHFRSICRSFGGNRHRCRAMRRCYRG